MKMARMGDTCTDDHMNKYWEIERKSNIGGKQKNCTIKNVSDWNCPCIEGFITSHLLCSEMD